jgi:hypothetical protein
MSRDTIGEQDIEKPTLYCSFCGKSQHEVKRLIVGPNVFICDECVLLCVGIVFEMDEEEKFTITAKQHQEALENMLPFVRTVLEREDKRHLPYQLLEQMLDSYDELTGYVPPPPLREGPPVVSFKHVGDVRDLASEEKSAPSPSTHSDAVS